MSIKPNGIENLRQQVSDDDVEHTLDKAMVLFRFLQDKDVFERYYKQHLAKRLLFQRSASTDDEQSMLTKLKHECGTQFTAKLDGMFKDIALSRTLVDQYKDHVDEEADVHAQFEGPSRPNVSRIELAMNVLTTGYWPLAAAQSVPELPREAAAAFASFKA